jgi:hypothetical protein
MNFITFIVALAAIYLVSAAPFKRTASKTDITVLQFADVLEQLETQFYKQGLDKFKSPGSFTSAGFASDQLVSEQLLIIQNDEATHSKALRSLLDAAGAKPVDNCKFNFDSVLTDVKTMAATARVVEQIGVGAYLGAAHLISNPLILEAAGSILTIEARHQTLLNIFNGGTPIPAAFDIALTTTETFTLASPFISGCDLPFKANPLLNIKTKEIAPGKKLEFDSPALKGNNDKLFCQMIPGGVPNSIALPLNECVIPAGINGPLAIWITNDSQPLINNAQDRATTQLVAGPAMTICDDPQQKGELGSLLMSGGAAKGGESASTQTISPSAASSIASSASGTETAAASGSAAPSPAGNVSTPPPNNSTSGGGPNEQTGNSTDGSLTVNGWTQVGNDTGAAGSSAASSPSSSSAAPSSSGGGGGGGGY